MVYQQGQIPVRSSTQLSGANQINVDTGSGAWVAASLTILAEWMAQNGALGVRNVYNTNAATAGTTLTAANITGGSAETVLAMTGTFSAPANIQLPTVAAMIAAIGSNVYAGFTYNLRIINVGSTQTLTVTTNTGWTLNGTADTIATATWRDFIVTINTIGASPTATLTDIGGGSVV